jgi:hypothetical protein
MEAARQLQQLWKVPKHKKVFDDRIEDTFVCFTSTLSINLMQQSRQHLQAIAAAMLFCLQQLNANEQQQQQRQQWQQQALCLLQEFVAQSSQQRPVAGLIVQLLAWLHSARTSAVDLISRPYSTAASSTSSSSSSHRQLQETWLAGMQVWQLMCLLAAAVGEVGPCADLVLLAHRGPGACVRLIAVSKSLWRIC